MNVNLHAQHNYLTIKLNRSREIKADDHGGH